MPNPKIGKNVTIVIPEEIIEEIDRISKKRKMKKAAIYRMMLEVGIDCHKDMEKLGIIAAVDFAHYVKTSVSKRLKSQGPKQMSLL